MFTIYTLGDVNTFRQILNAVAMVFGSGILSSGTGIGAGSAILAGLLVTLMLSLAAGALSFFGMGKQFNPGIVIVLLVIYVGMAVPKVSVQVEDLYTGTATTVDHIPVGLALPAALISTITKSVTEKLETAFSTTDGNYIAMTTQGFVNPLNLLLSMRQGVQNFDPYLVANIKAFTLDCAAGALTFDQQAFAIAPDAIVYLTTNYRDGLTLSFSPAAPQGVGVPCNQAATDIQTATADFLTSPKLDRLINSKMPSRATANTSTPNTWTAADQNATYNSLVAPVWGAAQGAQGFMTNALLSNTISNAFNCAHSKTDYQQLFMCEIALTQANEQWKSNAAGSAGFFTNMMIPGMNILLAMFYAFSPLVFIFAVMSSWHGIHILKNFLLFGAWTQTWLPFAAIINFIIQIQVVDEMNRFASTSTNGLTLAVSNDFYNMLSTKLAVASDMLASVPLVSFALLTGGAFAMSQVAKSWDGKGHTDEKQASPDILKTAPGVATGSVASQSSSDYSYMPGVGWRGDTGLAGSSLAKISTGNLKAGALSNVDAQTESYSTQAGIALSHGVQSMTGKDNAYDAFKAVGNEMGSSHDQVSKATQQVSDKLGWKQTYGAERGAAIEGAFGLGLNIAGTGANLKAMKKFSSKEIEDITHGYDQLMSRDNSIANSVKSAHSSSDGQRWSNRITSGMSATDAKQYTEATTHLDGLSKTRQALQSNTDSLGLSQSMDVQQMHAMLANRDGGRAALGANLDAAIHANHLEADAARLAANPAFAQELRETDPAGRAQMAQMMALANSPGGGNASFAGMVAGVTTPAIGTVGNAKAPDVSGMDAGGVLTGAAHSATTVAGGLSYTPTSAPRPPSGGGHSGAPASPDMPVAPTGVQGHFDGQYQGGKRIIHETHNHDGDYGNLVPGTHQDNPDNSPGATDRWSDKHHKG